MPAAHDLRARLEAPLVAADATAGTWRISSGAEVRTSIAALNNGRLIRLVIDLATLRAAAASIPALIDHQDWMGTLVGAWDEIAIAEAVTGKLRMLDVPAGQEALFGAVVQARTLVAQRIPLQASVGVAPDAARQGRYERLSAATQVNGRLIDPAADPDVPVYVLRNGLLEEASLVVFGADSATGRLRRTDTDTSTPKDPTMSFDLLKALLAKHPENKSRVAELVAEGKDQAAIEGQLALEATAALAADRDDLKAKLAAMTTERDELKAKLAKGAGKSQEMPGAGGGEDDQAVPKDLTAALSKHAPELKGQGMEARIAFVRKTYPTMKIR